jgi:hypothetical protein
MNALFTYNQEQAAQVGAGQWVTKSGGYDVKVASAMFTKSKTQGSQAQFLEMNFETRDGQKCNYVTICYVKGDGTQLDFGQKMVQAVMGSAGVQNLTVDANGNCPELLGKSFKAILQRTDYTNGSGEDKYKFEIKLAALMTGQTIQEQLGSKQAQAFAAYADSVEDQDKRTQPQAGGFGNQAPNQGNSHNFDNSKPQQANGTGVDFDDDIPF